MGRAAWELEADLDALGSGKRSKGRARSIFTALAFVGAATFVGAFYLPLLRTHEKLAAIHSQAQERLRTSEQKLENTENALRVAAARRDELETERKAVEAKAAAGAESMRSLHASLSRQLEAQSLLSVAARDDHVALSADQGAFFAAKGTEVGPPGQRLLCAMAKAAGPRRLSVHSSGAGAGSEAFDLAAARASSLVEALASRCAVSRTRLSMIIEGAGAPPGHQASPADNARFELRVFAD